MTIRFPLDKCRWFVKIPIGIVKNIISIIYFKIFSSFSISFHSFIKLTEEKSLFIGNILNGYSLQMVQQIFIQRTVDDS